MDFDLSGVFSPQYIPAIVTAFSGGLKAMGLMGMGKAGVQAAERKQQAAQFEATQLRINAGQAKAASQRDAYFKGLNFLLNEQPDKAIESFIEVVKVDPQTIDLHFALGSLFRRQGEVTGRSHSLPGARQVQA
jgi:Tfp pilus assembly protein PilF